jgi:hypothetical protein
MQLQSVCCMDTRPIKEAAVGHIWTMFQDLYDMGIFIIERIDERRLTLPSRPPYLVEAGNPSLPKADTNTYRRFEMVGPHQDLMW